MKAERRLTLSILQKYILLLLGVIRTKPLKGKLWLQKGIFLLSKILDELKNETYFEPHHMGPYSENLEVELDKLEALNLVEVRDGIKLTENGYRAFLKLKDQTKERELETILEIRELIEDLSEDELLALIYFTFKDMTTESRKLDEILKKRKSIALRLYLKGKVSLSKAAEIAGMNISEFMKYLRNRGYKIQLNK